MSSTTEEASGSLETVCELESLAAFYRSYTVGDTLEVGTFGHVVLAKNSKGEVFAAKILKNKTESEMEDNIREYNVLNSIKHPKVVELVGAFQSPKSFIILTKYYSGGELYARLSDIKQCPEKDVIIYVRQICDALNYLHSHNIVHLDLKLENIICVNDSSLDIRVIDFGLSQVVCEYLITTTPRGTKPYIAPEALDNKVMPATDMWAVGVITYLLLSGLMPFGEDDSDEIFDLISSGHYNYPQASFGSVSNLAKDFIDKLLVVEPSLRMTAHDALHHTWLQT